MNAADIDGLDWTKGGGLLPAIVQDADDGQVLMLGYMNRDALTATLGGGRVTFWSRSRAELWVKGDTSGKTFKPATLDTGIEVSVPLFCDIGTRIKLDTRDGSFAERVK